MGLHDSSRDEKLGDVMDSEGDTTASTSSADIGLEAGLIRATVLLRQGQAKHSERTARATLKKCRELAEAEELQATTVTDKSVTLDQQQRQQQGTPAAGSPRSREPLLQSADPRLELRLLAVLAASQREQGLHSEAAESAREGLDRCGEGPVDDVRRAELLEVQCASLIAQEQFDEAIAVADEGLSSLESSSARAILYLHRSTALQQLNRLREAETSAGLGLREPCATAATIALLWCSVASTRWSQGRYRSALHARSAGFVAQARSWVEDRLICDACLSRPERQETPRPRAAS